MTDETAGYGTFNMRFFFSVFLLGWWMSKQRWTSRGQSYPKPSISVNPGAIVALGENVRIRCTSLYEGATFVLYHQPREFGWKVKASYYEAVFPITNIKRSDQGSYRCYYCFSVNICSPSSVRINIQLAAQVYPKPFISGDTSGILTKGESTKIYCDSEDNPHTDFYLYKQGASLLQKAENIQSSKAVFRLINAQLSDAGIYTCSYCLDLNSVKQCSNFSDNILINMTDPSLGTPSISVRPRRHLVLDSVITIECGGPENGLNFSLYKASHLIASQMSEPSRNITSFVLSMKRLEDAGNYTCQYHHRQNPFVWSEPSNPVELIVTERSVTTIWAGCAAGLLMVLLLLLAFIVYRKRRKGPKISERTNVINTPLGDDTKTVYEEIPYGADLDGVIYAVLNQDSLKKQKTVSNRPPEPCVYASVAVDRNKEGP